MQIKQFTGRSVDDVLSQVRAELGEGAVVLQTRRVVHGGIGGFFGREGIEVTAAEGLPAAQEAAANLEAAASVAVPDASAPDAPPPADDHRGEETAAARPGSPAAAEEPAADPDAPFRSHLESRLAAAVEAEDHPAMAPAGAPASPAATYARAAGAPAPARPFAPGGEERSRAIAAAARAAVGEAHRRAEPAPEPSGAPEAGSAASGAAARPPRAARGGIDAVRAELRRAGVEDRHLDALLDGFADRSAPFLDPGAPVREAIREHLAARLPVARDWRPRRPGHMAAFIGQSGVGKTSVVAKLAGRMRAAGRAVAVVAAGAGPHDALATHARRLDVQLVRAADGAALAELRPLLADRDLVLVDTSGRRHGHPEEIEELAELIGPARPEEVHLVLPAATPGEDLGDAWRGFRGAGVNRVTLTKTDETRFLGSLVNVPLRTGRPLTHISCGTRVPEDVVPADGRRVAELLLP